MEGTKQCSPCSGETFHNKCTIQIGRVIIATFPLTALLEEVKLLYGWMVISHLLLFGTSMRDLIAARDVPCIDTHCRTKGVYLFSYVTGPHRTSLNYRSQSAKQNRNIKSNLTTPSVCMLNERHRIDVLLIFRHDEQFILESKRCRTILNVARAF